MSYDPYKQAPPNYQTAQAVTVDPYGQQQQMLAPVQGQPQMYNNGAVPVAAPQQQHFGYNGVQAVAPVPKAGEKPDIKNAEGGDFQFLSQTKRLLIKQRFEMLESLANLVGFSAIEFSNKYDIFDADTGQPILYAAEESDCLCRACCKPHHEAKLHIFDVRSGSTVPILRMEKPFKWNCCIIHDCCQQKQKTYTTNGQKLGSAKQAFPCGGFFTPKVEIDDEEGHTEMVLEGPCCLVGGGIEMCMDLEFKVKNKDDKTIGKLKHLKPEGAKEMLQQFAGDSDNYLLEMDENMSHHKVANLVGTLLLLDYMFFEHGGGCDPASGTINCCNIYCCGCLCPCEFGGSSGDAGGGGGGVNFNMDF